MEKEMKKNCRRCGKFERYYTKGLYRYEPVERGYCKKFRKIIDGKNACSNWTSRYARDKYHRQSALYLLPEILIELSAIRQIFEDTRSEDYDV